MTQDILLFIAVGFAAQLVDGAIGMAYGIVATTLLMSMGVPPAAASASVHASEIFTSAASGAAHWRLGNVDRALVQRLAIPGAVGGAIGTGTLVNMPSAAIRPVVSAYLLVVGLIILRRALTAEKPRVAAAKPVGIAGFVGGFLDAIGGGGWGALVTTTLIGWGITPRIAIGSANLAEFFVTAAITSMFVATIGITLWPVIVGLVIGGVLTAPIAAYAARHLPEKPVMILVGVVVSLLSLRGIAMAL
jgi:uncharacterized protein